MKDFGLPLTASLKPPPILADDEFRRRPQSIWDWFMSPKSGALGSRSVIVAEVYRGGAGAPSFPRASPKILDRDLPKRHLILGSHAWEEGKPCSSWKVCLPMPACSRSG
jgi:hypothetical protein